MSEDPRRFLVDDNVLLTFGDLDFSIYNAILRNLPGLLDLHVADLAKLAGVSNASVIRFCKKCGYSGFPDLKLAFSRQIQNEQVVAQLQPVTDRLNTYAQSGALDQLSKEIGAAYEILRWSRGVFFLGQGRSGGLAVYGASLFSSVGLLSLALTSFPTYLTSAPQEEGAAIVVSFDGTNPLLVAATQALAAGGYSMISITGNSTSPIAKLSDVCIETRIPKRYQGVATADMASRVPSLLAIEELARLLYNAELS